jgi:hypothetical protein
MRAEGWLVVVVLGVMPACLAPGFEDPFAEDEGESGATDGAECDSDDDCRSGACLMRTRLCAPSFCNCPGDDCPAGGAPSNDCSDNAVCVYYEDIFESVGEVFMIEHDMNGGYCRPLCSKGCPEHFTCTDGTYCQADSDWAAPSATVTWSGPVTGTFSGRYQTTMVEVEYDQPITITGSGDSPLGQEVTLSWMVSAREQTMPEGDSVTVMVESGYNSARVELMVRDEESRNAMATVIFNGCSGAGDACGYEGSGCCNGCDRDANTCM